MQCTEFLIAGSYTLCFRFLSPRNSSKTKKAGLKGIIIWACALFGNSTVKAFLYIQGIVEGSVYLWIFRSLVRNETEKSCGRALVQCLEYLEYFWYVSFKYLKYSNVHCSNYSGHITSALQPGCYAHQSMNDAFAWPCNTSAGRGRALSEQKSTLYLAVAW